MYWNSNPRLLKIVEVRCPGLNRATSNFLHIFLKYFDTHNTSKIRRKVIIGVY